MILSYLRLQSHLMILEYIFTKGIWFHGLTNYGEQYKLIKENREDGATAGLSVKSVTPSPGGPNDFKPVALFLKEVSIMRESLQAKETIEIVGNDLK